MARHRLPWVDDVAFAALDGAVEIAEMTREFAADVVEWRYPAPYDCYDMTSAEPAFLLDPANGYFAVVDGGALVGFRSFGEDGRVPGGRYDDTALDTGGGLRPELTGKGFGRQAIRAGLEFGRRRFAPAAFRATIATFNERALRVVESLGFRRVAQFSATTNGRSYEILVRPEPDRRSLG